MKSNKEVTIMVVLLFLIVIVIFGVLKMYSKKIVDVNENLCEAGDRKVGACIEIYKPVCGWFDSNKIQCIKYPCAQTFSNSCFACMNENVLYWTEGECPE